ncbi:GH1 family beta-glucosidase [Oceanispirochaeta sp.]|jgi:beta-glucosidase|uniref:GH1 family beta-glucosidase n=1 Tax=Oceanispirochaeta sp. TaxID=2035350 RepID=UPI00262A7582|nr:GH1 family beta-glucosidase [Oceanispirochaeta sp.]MDA3958553.1 GH1 family beta-glucosidase [Oceanispirochaeta sp.]
MKDIYTFPENFKWGTATASYQIEGAVNEDGRAPSIWDTFAHKSGKIDDNMTGDVTCDHYHKYKEDIAHMKDLGIRNYRFSLSWSRIIPEGSGKVNQKGLDFYSRLVDELLTAGITPYATLFHWDLPQALQDAGGWANRETAYKYRDYADVVCTALGGRVKNWMTHNEPWVHSFVGHLYGDHAPGLKDLKTALQTAHHMLLAHGLAIPVIREKSPGARIGIVNNLEWIEPASMDSRDRDAADRHDGAFNRWFLDPVFYGSYPKDMMDWYGSDAPEILSGDMKTISAPIDFLGVNFYTRRIIAHENHGNFLKCRQVRYPFMKKSNYEEWENNAEGLYRLLIRLKTDYGNPEMMITENGTPLPDVLEANGEVHDPERIDYLYRHMGAAWQAIEDGVRLKGYFVWSLLDNFEWCLGFTKRFGLLYTDYETGKRIVKDSGHWYSDVCRKNRIEL